MFDVEKKSNDELDLDVKSIVELDGLEKNIKNDISHVDNRMSDLQMYITSLDSQIKKLGTNLDSFIKSASKR